MSPRLLEFMAGVAVMLSIGGVLLAVPIAVESVQNRCSITARLASGCLLFSLLMSFLAWRAVWEITGSNEAGARLLANAVHGGRR